ncbi:MULTISPECIES: IS200/IS605 family transposase [Anoxybacillus]|uniref:IS200/IS605 family transposase n=1 Tax=Anoxybacillus flavithermus TaxID=33934 RepID=A0AAX1ZXK0_9BACL|nr:IS200/IS605 family transposase [Anoxybacillus flavithermus]ASA95793.1 IS200/IS605 family transposase [Anoxybacillus flavithermus]ELK22138.1 transposase, IS200/IS605 family [Anoxybacillus flavithermus TNO-09.006]MBE2906562.1 IS200/IS605 family transposase [Anoxybacillus flavithermus]MBE2908869.1 IS200/IS605 family transposase [Anoxybacillus flavithermus]MBE2914268.1 IS200/IS605 family transposase [Anoxybacillus flavithermus]
MENEKYTDKKGIVYLNQYHIVFCPKYRRKVLVGDIERDLKRIFEEVAKEHDVQIKAMEIMPDHVHLFISFDPRQHLHKIIQAFKRKSSRILREKYPSLKSRLPSLWTRSYFCCTVGHISEEAVKQYIENQKNV